MWPILTQRVMVQQFLFAAGHSPSCVGGLPRRLSSVTTAAALALRLYVELSHLSNQHGSFKQAWREVKNIGAGQLFGYLAIVNYGLVLDGFIQMS